MQIKSFSSGPFETNSYLYYEPNGEGLLIDAPPDSYLPVIQFVKENNLRLTHLLLTHSHWDHIADCARFKKELPSLKIAIHPLDQKNLEEPGSDELPCWISIEGVEPDLLLKEGDLIGPLQVIETPGHTPGGVAFYDEKGKLLFSGDTLFKGTIGNLSFPTARPELMWKSLGRLAKLPQEVVVLPGHGDSTTLGQEAWLPDAEKYFG